MKINTQPSNPVLPVAIYEPQMGKIPRINWRELWAYRELLYFLTWRDIKIRYKQAALGVAWAILQPVITMIIFSVIFGHLANLPSEGIPYPIFSFAALRHFLSRSPVRPQVGRVGLQELFSESPEKLRIVF